MTVHAASYRDNFAGEIAAVASHDICHHVARATPTPRIIRRTGPDPHASWRPPITYAWCVIGPRDKSNNYTFALQWVKGMAGGARVRVGCRYKTLPQAWRYIKDRSRGWQRNKYQQAECIIRLMVLQAQAAGLPGAAKMKFDASLNKRRKA